MSEARLIEELHELGIDERSVRVLALLPLIETAWSQGVIQSARTDVVGEIARLHFQLDEDATALLGGWMANPPSATYLQRAREVLHALAERASHGREGPLPAAPEAVDVAMRVARATSDLFGWGFMPDEERRTLDLLRAAMGLPAAAPWHELEDVGDEPTDLSAIHPPMPTPKPATTAPVGTVPALEGHGSARLVRADGTVVAILADGSDLSIGRGGQNRLQVRDDGEVSRNHARIFQKNGAWYVEDRGSMNGTRVGGEFITVRRLFGGEEIGIGHGQFRFQLDR